MKGIYKSTIMKETVRPERVKQLHSMYNIITRVLIFWLSMYLESVFTEAIQSLWLARGLSERGTLVMFYLRNKIHFLSLGYDMKLVAWLNSIMPKGCYSKFDHAPTLCHIPMTLKNMNFISYIYISDFIMCSFGRWHSKMNFIS
jgi:hypothetical protein